jgi:hypothetical protein
MVDFRGQPIQIFDVTEVEERMIGHDRVVEDAVEDFEFGDGRGKMFP